MNTKYLKDNIPAASSISTSVAIWEERRSKEEANKSIRFDCLILIVGFAHSKFFKNPAKSEPKAKIRGQRYPKTATGSKDEKRVDLSSSAVVY